MRSLSKARRFYVKKKVKLGRRINLHLTENQFNRNETWCSADDHNYMCHLCVKGILDLNFNYAVIDKTSNFHKILLPQISQKPQFFTNNWNFLDQLLLPYKFYGRDM